MSDEEPIKKKQRRTKRTVPDFYKHIDERKCWKCEEVKPRDNFSKDKYDIYGLQKRCKACDSFFLKKFTSDNPGYFEQKSKENYDKNDNPARYQATRPAYLTRKKVWDESVYGRLYQLVLSAVTRSKKKNMDCDITHEWVTEQFHLQNGKSLLTEIELNFARSPKKKKGGYVSDSPSLDRIDSNKGYTKDNVRLVCTHINLALNNFGIENFQKLIAGYMKTNKLSLEDLQKEDSEESVHVDLHHPE